MSLVIAVLFALISTVFYASGLCIYTGPNKAYAGVVDKLRDVRAKVDINYKRRYITEQFNNLLRAMFAVIVQGDYLGYKNDAKGEGYLYGSFIHFPVEINGEKYEANAWLYIRGPSLEAGGLPRRKIMYAFKNLNFVEYNIFLQKPGDNNVKHRKTFIVVGVGANDYIDDKAPPHNADVYGYRLSARVIFARPSEVDMDYAVAKKIPHVIEEIKKYIKEKKGVEIQFNNFKYDENNRNY